MPNVDKDTRVLKDPITGELVSVPAAEADERATRDGLEYATLGEISKFNEREKYGSAGQTALAAGELALEAATLGIAGADDDETRARRRVLRRDSPILAAGAEFAGVLPGVAAGALTGGAAPALGLGMRAARVASIVAEGGVSGYATEQVAAREEGRDIDVGNILMYGVGGEIAGRVIPKALGSGLRRLAGGSDEALDAADNVLVRAEQRATQSGTELAEAAPGPERDRFLKDNARDLMNGAAERARKNLDQASAKFQDLGDISKKRDKISRLVSKEHVGQDRWVADQLENLDAMRREMRGAGPKSEGKIVDFYGDAVPDQSALDEATEAAETLASGKNIEDMHALELGPDDRASVEGIKARKDFQETGNVHTDNQGSSPGGLPQFTLEGGKLYMSNGRHRWTAAQEMGRTHIIGRIVKYTPDGEEAWAYIGPVRVSGKPATRGAALGEVQGLKGMVSKLEKFVDDAETKLTKSRKASDRFIAADEIKRGLQKFHVSLAKSRQSALDPAYHDQLQSIVDAVQETVRRGLQDESLWGRAGRFQADVNSAWHNRWFQGAPVAEADLARVTGRDFDAKAITEFDPAKLRSFLEKDKVGRGLTEEKLAAVLDGYQEMAEAHRKWGMTSPAELDALQSNVAEIRRALSEADEIQAATPRAAKAEAAEAAMDQLISQGLPLVGSAYVATKRALRNINTAGKSHIRSSANTLVNGTRKVGRALESAGDRGAGAVGTVAAGQLRERQTTEDRFKGQHPTVTQAFMARRQQIATAMQEPGQLSEAITASLGDLPESMPDVHFRLVQRMTQAFFYLSQNLPPSVENSLLSQHSTPPDVQAIRQFARLWEAVMDPGAVVQDVATMHATIPQMRAIEAVHPDIFEQLQNDAIMAIASSPNRPSWERLRYLNQMFKLGPALGGIWKPSVALNIKNSMTVAPPPSSEMRQSLQTSPDNPRGIASIASGPTSGA
jgi:hypothetical protein